MILEGSGTHNTDFEIESFVYLHIQHHIYLQIHSVYTTSTNWPTRKKCVLYDNRKVETEQISRLEIQASFQLITHSLLPKFIFVHTVYRDKEDNLCPVTGDTNTHTVERMSGRSPPEHKIGNNTRRRVKSKYLQAFNVERGTVAL